MRRVPRLARLPLPAVLCSSARLHRHACSPLLPRDKGVGEQNSCLTVVARPHLVGRDVTRGEVGSNHVGGTYTIYRDWEDPDHWVEDGAELVAGPRSRRAIHTPGTPAGARSSATPRTGSCSRGTTCCPTSRRPSASSLPSTGWRCTTTWTRCGSTHRRVHELLEYREERLAAMYVAVEEGGTPATADVRRADADGPLPRVRRDGHAPGAHGGPGTA